MSRFADLDAPYALTSDQIESFRTDGFIRLPDVLSAETLEHYGSEITRLVKELNTEDRPLAERDTYSRAFLQVMNLWRESPLVEAFVRGQRLARLAADLLGVDSVRLYHDQALYKEPGGGITPWHADQYYWPLASDLTVTAWIPLVEVPLAMGPLAFSVGSHRHDMGRSLEISDESEAAIAANLAAANLPLVEESFALGSVSFHYGWTFHRAGGNSGDRAREVMTIIYMDGTMRLAEPANKNQVADWETWCPGARVGEVIDTPLNPMLFQR